MAVFDQFFQMNDGIDTCFKRGLIIILTNCWPSIVTTQVKVIVMLMPKGALQSSNYYFFELSICILHVLDKKNETQSYKMVNFGYL